MITVHMDTGFLEVGKLESLSGGTLVLIFLCCLVAFPAIGLACGTLASIFCEFICSTTSFLFDGFIKKIDYQTITVEYQKNIMINYAAEFGKKYFYLLGTAGCILILIISLIIAGLAYFGPLIVGLALLWTYSPVAELILVIATGIFILTYVATMIVAIIRTTD